MGWFASRPMRSASLLPFQGVWPTLGANVWLADTARVIGDVHLGADVNIWHGAALRGDVASIRVGEGTNIQENAVVHVTTGKPGTTIGVHATIGHGAIVHACTVGQGALVGMGATVLDEAVLEPFSMLAAGAVLSPGKTVPTGWLWAGVPARPMRPLTPDEQAYLRWSGPHYVQLAAQHRTSYAAK